MIFSSILAVDDNNGIGKNNDLAWRIKADMKYFNQITVQTHDENKVNAVIMGRKTWDSIPEKYRPLPNRKNYVLSRDSQYKSDGCITGTSLDEILEIISLTDNIENIFILGGSHLYNQVLSDPRLDKIYLTQVKGDYDCDVFFDGVPENFKVISESEKHEENNINFQFKVFKKRK